MIHTFNFMNIIRQTTVTFGKKATARILAGRDVIIVHHEINWPFFECDAVLATISTVSQVSLPFDTNIQ